LSFIAAAELLRATSDGSVDYGRLLTVYSNKLKKTGKSALPIRNS
jgi:hypothetical protein